MDRPPSPRRAIVIGAVIAAMAIPATAVANHFTDVPNGYVHEPGIDYLEATGITAGCAPAEFCPTDGLTRAQMGTFLHRASGNAPGTAPSVNAAELAGQPPSAYTTTATAMTVTGAPLAAAVDDATSLVIADLQDAPPGRYVVTGQLHAQGGTSARLVCRTVVDGTAVATAIGRVGSNAGHAQQLALPITALGELPSDGPIQVRCHAEDVGGVAPTISSNPTRVIAMRVGDL